MAVTINGSGQIVSQVKQTTVTSATSSYSSGSWHNIMSVTITPSSTSSKILLSTMISCSTADDTAFRFYRGGTAIGLGNSTGDNRTLCTFGLGSRDTYELANVHGQYLDSPSTTSAITYYIYVRPNYETFYLNRAEYDVNDANTERGICTFTAMEISQ